MNDDEIASPSVLYFDFEFLLLILVVQIMIKIEIKKWSGYLISDSYKIRIDIDV